MNRIMKLEENPTQWINLQLTMTKITIELNYYSAPFLLGLLDSNIGKINEYPESVFKQEAIRIANEIRDAVEDALEDAGLP